MKARIFLVSLGIVFPWLTLRAQYVQDALRYSQTSIQGSARFQGMAGVNAALGADVSSISGNPAGLGFFRKSEWSISPSLVVANTNSTYLSNSTTDGKVNFNIANMGIVFASPKSNVTGGNWRGGSFGISYSRLNNYQNRFTFQGNNGASSFTDYLADISFNIPEVGNQLPYLLVPEDQIGFNVPEDIGKAQLGYLGYLTELLRQEDTNNDGVNDLFEYKTAAGNDLLTVNQRGVINTTGAQSQWNFSYGGNIADKFFFGASLGITRVRSGYEKSYREVVVQTDERDLDNYTWIDYYDAIGTGVNATLGAIFKPNDIIRFGASITTPTYYRFTEEFSSRLNANFATGSPVSLETVTNNYDYNLTTPFRASAGVAFFAGKNGFISGDVEYIPYNSPRYQGNLRDQNQEIQNVYRPAMNYKIGGEYRVDIFRLRSGLAYFSDPYDNGYDDLDRSRLNFTAGAGIRLPNFYIDLAAVHTRFKSGYTPYVFDPTSPFSGSEPSATIQNAFTNAVISVGMFF